VASRTVNDSAFSSTDHGGGNRRSNQSAHRESNQIERPDRLRGFPAAKGAFHPRALWPHLVPTRDGAPGSMQRSVYIHMVMIGQKRRKDPLLRPKMLIRLWASAWRRSLLLQLARSAGAVCVILVPGLRRREHSVLYRVLCRPQSSSASRFTAGAFGFFTFTQCADRPER
jgi:hypothetical protein